MVVKFIELCTTGVHARADDEDVHHDLPYSVDEDVAVCLGLRSATPLGAVAWPCSLQDEGLHRRVLVGLAETLVPIVEPVLREDQAIERLGPTIEHFELLKLLAQELVERRLGLGLRLVRKAPLQVGLDDLERIVNRLWVLLSDLGHNIRDD